jgi:hypothetical protein
VVTKALRHNQDTVNGIGAMTLPGTYSYYLKKEAICINSRSWFKTLEDKEAKESTCYYISILYSCGM